MKRRTETDLPGACVDAHGVARFRVWAPQAQSVKIVSPDGARLLLALERETGGYFTGSTETLAAGSTYKIRVDDAGPWPDPCSRYQPEGPHGPSQLVAPDRFRWTDSAWTGLPLRGQVLYEMHVGTFTAHGTFDAARERLPHLRDVGITTLEVMPIAEFPGRWNWGYDGVQLYAPFHGYGEYEAFKRFVDAAHGLGLAVILDVVYNHFGPDGNYLRCFSEHYFSARHCSEWGEGLNYDAEHSNGLRDLVIGNVVYWAREFHLDGFRFDATQAIVDDSDIHIIAEAVRAAREAVAPRTLVFFEENEPQHARHMQSLEAGGFGVDAMWNDDFHHAARVALTGSRDGYYFDYTGRARELLNALRHGFLFQGQYYHWQKQRRGEFLPRTAVGQCVHFLQNHDQVGNTIGGTRLTKLARADALRALTAVWLLGPQIPLFFMGQEFGCSRDFHFFADHSGDLADAVSAGRRAFMQQFRAFDPDDHVDPGDPATFEQSRLTWNEVERHGHIVSLHRDLLRIRRDDPVISLLDAMRMEGSVLSDRAFVVRWFDDAQGDRLLVANLGEELRLEPNPEPLLAPPADGVWRVLWSSEDARYGGSGTRSPVSDDQQWLVPAHCTVLMRVSND